MAKKTITNAVGVLLWSCIVVFLLVCTVTARGDEVQLRYSVVATAYDSVTKKEYVKLRYDPAGDFATKDECLVWVAKADPQFVLTIPKLVQRLEEVFGPDVTVRFDCLAPEPPGTKI